MSVVCTNRLTKAELEANYSCTSNIVKTEKLLVIKMAHLIDLLYPGSESPQKNTEGSSTNKQDFSHSRNTLYKMVSDSTYMKSFSLG